MRRMSIGISLLILMPGITQAYHSISYQSRVRYSPYASGYGKSGLVPGGVGYSPHAFGTGMSGLTFEGLRYTPYASGYGKSGLVLDYYWWPIPYVVCSASCPSDQQYRQCDSAAPAHRNSPAPYGRSAAPRTTYRAASATGQTPSAAPCASTRQPRRSGQEDPLYVLRQQFRDQGFSNVAISRILRVENKLVSVDFTLTDRNLLIKYWDPQQVERLNAKTDAAQRVFARYKENWERFAGEYERNGGTIRHIAASGREEIVAALQSCIKPDPGESTPAPQTLYAKQ